MNPPEEKTCFACGHSLADPTPAAMSAPMGQRLIRQRYRLLRQIGVGGFGAVYKAEDTALGNRLVAVKEMSAGGLTSEEQREATEAVHQEALLLARLSHPNLPRIYEQFEEAGRWCLVMEFIEGQSLDDYLAQQGGRLPVAEALQIGLQLTKVLGYLHSRQPPIVFRDLKPSNVMRTPDGQVYLIDFGIARLFKPGQQKDTMAFGSPGYAAPEQYGKAQTTPRSDVFSLGALLHHLLTGNDPSETPFRFKPLTMPRPAGLSTLIQRMVDLDTARRPATMELVRHDLERMASDQAPWRTEDAGLAQSGVYITPASAQATGGYPRLAPAPPSWQGQNAFQPVQGGPVLQPPPTKQKSKNWGWVMIIVLASCVLCPALFGLINHTNTYTSTYPSDPFPNGDGYDYTPNTYTPVTSDFVPVYALSWSPDGHQIASGGADGKIAICQIAHSCNQPTNFSTNLAAVITLDWSPDGQYIAVAGDAGKVQIWRASGNLVKSFSASSAHINALSWASDSKHLALASQDGTMQVVDALTGGDPVVYQSGGDPVRMVAWSPDGKYIASSRGDQTVQVWDSKTKKAAHVYHDDKGVIEVIAWSPNSKRIASSDSSRQVQVWDALTGGNHFTYTSSDGVVDAIAWSPNGRYLASGNESYTVQVWAMGNNKPLFTYTGHTSVIRAVAWSSNSERVASASYDGAVMIWDALTGKNVVAYQQP
jgi:serine/threonine protein kinase